MTAGAFAAVDLGASSGRVMLGRVGEGRLELTEVHRFPNEPLRLPDGLHWDVAALFREVLLGLRQARRMAPDLASIGVDSWAIDYGLLDTAGELIGPPFHYRDARTVGVAETVHRTVSAEALYARTGVQELPFTTIYQLAAARGSAAMRGAATLLMIPDLLCFWLTGERGAEETNASTTGLLDVHSRQWADDLMAAVGAPRTLFPDVRQPGTPLGPVSTRLLADDAGAAPVVTLVGSHDTASAVVGVPAGHGRTAYIACGTWALVGVELERPLVTEDARLARFTNEAGVDGRVRFLHNVMGLWLLQESLSAWGLSGDTEALARLLAGAAAEPAGGPRIDPTLPMFLPPGDMPARIADACRVSDQAIPGTRAQLVRCILDSLAAAFASAIRDAARLTGRQVELVHLVGGGARNTLLCQLTADALELPVLAGPVEATALGNVLVQARAHGAIRGDLEALRALVRTTQPITTFLPRTAPSIVRP